MAYFAKIDENNIVVEMAVVPDEEEYRGCEFLVNDLGNPGQWIQTSYTGRIRSRFARIGYSYDPVNDVFLEPIPYEGWVLDENFNWIPPTPRPIIDGSDFVWSESKKEWVEIRRNIGDTKVVILGDE